MTDTPPATSTVLADDNPHLVADLIRQEPPFSDQGDLYDQMVRQFGQQRADELHRQAMRIIAQEEDDAQAVADLHAALVTAEQALTTATEKHRYLIGEGYDVEYAETANGGFQGTFIQDALRAVIAARALDPRASQRQ
jgi:hypothetical protein